MAKRGAPHKLSITTKNEFDKIQRKIDPNAKYCIDCNNSIFYYDSRLLIDCNDNLRYEGKSYQSKKNYT